MSKLSKTIERKFISTINISDYEVLSDTGFVDITQIHKTIEYEEWKLITESGKELICADTHILYDKNFNEIFAKDALNKTIVTKNGSEKVIDVIKLNKSSNMFDLSVNSLNQRYYTNNILSHNTITLVAYLLHFTIFTPDVTIGVAAHKGSGAKEIISRFRYAYENLPLFLKPAVESYNVFDIAFDNGSRILSQTTTESTYRGMSLSCLYLDEFAFVKPSISEEFWKSILPTLSAPGSKMIITSTPNGSENKFAEIWFKAVQNENDFNPIEVLNEEVPGRETPEFKQQMLKDMTELEYAQEYENQFISSSGTLIYSPILEALKPIEPIDTYGDLRIFKSPENRRLALSVDVGTGVGQDYSVIEVFDLDTFEQVAEFRNNQMNITDFTKTLIDILRYFHKRTDKEIIYTIEANSIGQGVIQLIENSNIGFLKDIEMISERKRSGILMTTKSKPKGCSRLKDLIESGKMKIYSRYLISELKFFVKSGESFKAEKGKHDDLVMGCVLFCLLLNEIMDYDEDVYEALNTVGISNDVDEDDSSPLPFII